MVSLLGSNFEMMPRKTGASALIAHSDSSLRSARRSHFSSPRGQPCLCCWLVSPPRWREASPWASLPVAVPVFGPALLCCFCACTRDAMSFGGVVPMPPRATRPRVTPPLTSNLHRQLVCPPNPTNTAGRVTARLKFHDA